MFRFPWGDMHSLNLGWFLQKFNELREDWATAEAGIDGALDAEIQRAEDALSDVFDARDAAAASATAAAGSATAAAGSATTAGTSATAAQNSATAAAGSATLANNKASAAGLSEAAAAQSANNAAASAANANTSANAAAASAANAVNSAAAAGTNATAAATSAANAATSANSAAADAERAEEAAESIPADYTELANNVTELTNDFNEISENTKNLLNPDNITQENGFTYSNGVYTNNNVDTRASLMLKAVFYYDSELVLSRGFPNTALGENILTVTLSSAVNRVRIAHNGIARDLGITFDDVNLLADTPYTVSCNVIQNDPTVIGGIEFTNLQLEAGSSATPYIPAKTAIDFDARQIPDMIAPILDSMEADAALVADDFRIVNNTLYRITAPVAAGGTLTPGTNCAATTVAEILKSLLS